MCVNVLWNFKKHTIHEISIKFDQDSWEHCMNKIYVAGKMRLNHFIEMVKTDNAIHH